MVGLVVVRGCRAVIVAIVVNRVWVSVGLSIFFIKIIIVVLNYVESIQ